MPEIIETEKTKFAGIFLWFYKYIQVVKDAVAYEIRIIDYNTAETKEVIKCPDFKTAGEKAMELSLNSDKDTAILVYAIVPAKLIL